MIKSNMDNFFRYFPVHPKFKLAYEALLKIAQMPFGKKRYMIDGDNLFINAVEYDTKDWREVKFEAHRRYIDIMLVLSGEETIGCTAVEGLSDVYLPYDASRDALLAGMEPGCSKVHMHNNDVVVFFPEDAHAPGIIANHASHVRKLIAKVLL